MQWLQTFTDLPKLQLLMFITELHLHKSDLGQVVKLTIELLG